MRGLVVALAVVLMTTACNKAQPQSAADGGSKSGLTPCLDRPTDLARPPTGQLPCDMLPPGFSAAH